MRVDDVRGFFYSAISALAITRIYHSACSSLEGPPSVRRPWDWLSPSDALFRGIVGHPVLIVNGNLHRRSPDLAPGEKCGGTSYPGPHVCKAQLVSKPGVGLASKHGVTIPNTLWVGRLP